MIAEVFGRGMQTLLEVHDHIVCSNIGSGSKTKLDPTLGQRSTPVQNSAEVGRACATKSSLGSRVKVLH